ncbi:MAG: pyridoxal phosphate-dependent aminotransferase [Acidobacteria bacterium]|nr:pyridoxal phosphate-dependent aminotransferase [Acidobacteriota bacterium]
MFSSRIKWDLAPNRLARLIAEKRARGEIILDLTESNPTRAGFEYPVKEILDALARPDSMLYEPASRGLMVAREAVSRYYAERGAAVDPDRIHLTASTSESYSWLFKLLTDFGQSVLIPHPSYPLFEFLAALEGVELRPFNLDYIHPSGWRIDFDSLEQAIDAGTRAIILVNPNNPTGTYLKQDELERLNLICARHSLALIVDEVFSDYAFEDDGRRVTSLVDNSEVLTFVLNGFSKVLALPQMKLGWIVTGGTSGGRSDRAARPDSGHVSFSRSAGSARSSKLAGIACRIAGSDQGSCSKELPVTGSASGGGSGQAAGGGRRMVCDTGSPADSH